jgi:hypothetical protein
MFCQQCGAETKGTNNFCEKCGVHIKKNHTDSPSFQTYQPPVYSDSLQIKQRNPALAAVASFLWTGMGQVYTGNLMKGFAFLIGAIIGSLVFTIPGFIVWAYGIYDAYTTAKKMNNGEIAFVPVNNTQIIIFIVGTVVIIGGLFVVAVVFYY